MSGVGHGERLRPRASSADARYWDSVAPPPRPAAAPAPWRALCDGLYADLLRAWLPAGPLGVLLKTDAYDEAAGVGPLAPLRDRIGAPLVVDVSRGMLRAACAAHPGLRACVADVRALPLAGASIDVAFSGSTLDHFPSLRDVEAGLGELARVVRPGGVLIVTLDNLANPAVALRNALPARLLRRLRLVPYAVGASCGPARLRALLQGAGFDVVAMRGLMHGPRAPAVLAASILRRLGARGRPLVAAMRGFELLEWLPSRWLTAYYVAALARRR